MKFRSLKFQLRHGHLPVREDDCTYLWEISPEERCEWVKNTRDCTSDSVVQYTEGLFCIFGPEFTLRFGCGLILLVLWLLYLFLILGTTADNFFCPSLAVIAGVLRLSESIAGVTILAFGNGAPDIFTSLVARDDDVIIMFTELIGAGIFVSAVIAGSVAVIKPFRVRLKPFLRDVCFYMSSICWITYVVRDEKVYLWEAGSFLLCYVLFIVAVVLMQLQDSREEYLKNRIPSVPDADVLRAYLANEDTAAIPKIPVRSRPFNLSAKLDVAIATELEKDKVRNGSPTLENTDEEETKDSKRPTGLWKEFFYDINPISVEDWRTANGIVKFILIIRSPVMLILQLFIPVVNTTSTKKGWSKLLNCFQLCVAPTMALFLLNVWHKKIGSLPIVPVFLSAGTLIGLIVFLTTELERPPKFHNVFAFLGFLAAMLTVYLLAGEVMAVLGSVGYAFKISDAMLGITFLAWGNSVGDLISNIAIARQGFPRMGYAACFGGPMFNTLLGLGLTYGISAAKHPDKYTNIRTSDMAPGCVAFLLCSLSASIIYLTITGALARRTYGYLLYSVYFTFILILFLSEFHVIHPLGTDHRPDDPVGDHHHSNESHSNETHSNETNLN